MVHPRSRDGTVRTEPLAATTIVVTITIAAGVRLTLAACVVVGWFFEYFFYVYCCVVDLTFISQG